jgi:uncharacterized membrane protein YgcG
VDPLYNEHCNNSTSNSKRLPRMWWLNCLCLLLLAAVYCLLYCRSGYFTSRPTSKGYIRQATAYLAAARQLQALVPTPPPATPLQQQQHARHVAAAPFDGSNGGGSGGSNGGGGGGCGGGNGGNGGSNGGSSLDALEAAVSLTQHHDAVTGTEKQAVANDYAR